MDLLPVEGDSNVQISREMQVTRPKQHLSAQQAIVDHLEMMIASPRSLAAVLRVLGWGSAQVV